MTQLKPASAGALMAPPVSAFPKFPASWYLFCASRELRAGPLSKHMLGRHLVAYRGESGIVAVMDARCSHLAADLGSGKVIGDRIRCPFHAWEYGTDGRCVKIPHLSHIPVFARQQCYPAAERHGMIFVFNGPEALFPLPFFFGEDAVEFVADRPTVFTANSSWYMVAAHGYDLQHFETVHGRRLTTPLRVDCPAPFARRSSYTAEIVGKKYYDRFLRRVAGNQVAISITTWGGTLVLISGEFRRAHSNFMIALQPIEEERTECDVVVFRKRASSAVGRALRDPLSLWLRKKLTRGYLVDEVSCLGQPRYRPHRLIEADRDMIEYFNWAARLPQTAGRPLARGTAT
jgi:nitrite reductase/ring-hydroxylating ferredoxin subunit